MKKKNLKNLRLNKEKISNLSMISVNGGAEVSIRETNCDYCPGPQPEPDKPKGDNSFLLSVLIGGISCLTV